MLKFCPQCKNSPWPFAMVLVVSTVSAFVTWLTLSFAQFGDIESLAGSGLVFAAVGTTLFHYVINCMKRHCRHGTAHDQHGHHVVSCTPGAD